MVAVHIFSRYRIIEELDRDSLSILYKANEEKNNLGVVVKVFGEKIKSMPLEAILRFRREIGVICGIEHPNILRVLDGGECEGREYMVSM